MGIIRTATERLRDAERENKKLRAELEETKAATDYISMMCDVDIPVDDKENMEEISEENE